MTRRSRLPKQRFDAYDSLMADATSKIEPVIQTAVQDGPVSVVNLPWPGDCGAEGVFLGRTRDETHPEFGRLIHLEYEVFEPMALKLFDEMAREAVDRWGCQAVRVAHAKGVVRPGEASVVIQVATPHRGESFEASRYLIDRLKHESPIWKREVWERGETYVEGCCAHHPEDRKPAPPREK